MTESFFGLSRESEITTVLKSRLIRLLSDVDQNVSGSFATSGLLSSSNPQLYVHGLGSISLPLSDHDAVALRATCQQSPFGMGSETLIDTAVRKSWELDPHRFDVRSLAWQACVNEALERLGKDLGIVGGQRSMRADLYKLLLYEEGSFFKRHRDSEKAPGMFGTLVISLPCCHTGGDVETSFGGRQQILKTADASDFGYSYLAWYADVEHAVQPITSGYRLALIYNLIFTAPGTPQSASTSAKKKLELEKLLSSWKRTLETAGSGAPELLAYTTEHKYTDANLRFDYLKGKDRYRAQYLKDACGRQGFGLFLANFEYMVNGECVYEEPYRHSRRSRRGYDYDDHDYDYDHGNDNRSTADFHKLEDITSSEFKLRILMQTNGVMVVKDIPMPQTYIVQREAFQGIPEQEDYIGYTGNAGVEATHYYRNTCLVILPRTHLIDVLFEPATNGNGNLCSWLGSLLEMSRVNPDDQHCKDDLTNSCNTTVQWCRSQGTEQNKQMRLAVHDGRAIFDDLLGFVVDAALFLQSPELLRDAASVATKCLLFSVFKAIGSALTKFDLSDWKQGIESAVQTATHVHERYQALNALIEGYEASAGKVSDGEASDGEASDGEASDGESSDGKASDNESYDHTDLDILLEFMLESITVLLTCDCEVVREDGKALVDIATRCGDHYMFETVLPFVKSHVSNSSFAIAFFACLFRAGESGSLDTEVVTNVFADVLSDFLDDFKLEYQVASNKRVRYTEALPHRRTEIIGKPPTIMVAADDIVMLIGYCISLKNSKAINRILRRIRKDATTIDTSAFHDLLVPILKGLLRKLQRLGVPLVLPQYQSFFQDILDLYIQRYVGMEPYGESNWTRPPIGCGCAECRQLDHFLADPDNQEETYVLPPARRAHLHQRIGNSCKHETKQISLTATLVVTKIENPPQTSIWSWMQRRNEAIQNFKVIGTREAVQEILGDRYRDLRTFRAIRLSTAASTQP
ncbi:hypothetical protein MMC27_006280 [Xylographa pallens]|nr:hypothetical protein [Xylographa pallens]